MFSPWLRVKSIETPPFSHLLPAAAPSPPRPLAIKVSWRLAIEDPLEPHDLGRVVHSRAGMIHILGELRRGALLLLQAASAAAAEGAKEEDIAQPPADPLHDELWVTLTAVNTAVPAVPFSCRLCGSYDHAPRDCPTNVCRHCNKPGHFANVRLVCWLH